MYSYVLLGDIDICGRITVNGCVTFQMGNSAKRNEEYLDRKLELFFRSSLRKNNYEGSRNCLYKILFFGNDVRKVLLVALSIMYVIYHVLLGEESVHSVHSQSGLYDITTTWTRNYKSITLSNIQFKTGSSGYPSTRVVHYPRSKHLPTIS